MAWVVCLFLFGFLLCCFTHKVLICNCHKISTRNRKRCPTVWMMWWSAPSLPLLLSLDWLKSWLLTLTWTAPGSLPQYCREQKHDTCVNILPREQMYSKAECPVLLNCRGYLMFTKVLTLNVIPLFFRREEFLSWGQERSFGRFLRKCRVVLQKRMQIQRPMERMTPLCS